MSLTGLGLVLLLVSPSSAQDSALHTPPTRSFGSLQNVSEATVGSELEKYLRVLQVDGRAPLQSWTIRGFSVTQLEARLPTATDPWGLYDSTAQLRRRGAILPIRPEVRGELNSGFPFGMNDGPVWAGRGVTLNVHGGFAAKLGPISLALDPQVFVAQNAPFHLLENGLSGDRQYAEGQQPEHIDLPQRFGKGVYARADPGNSYVEAQFAGAVVGLSTASQWWGPAIDSPLLLGNNAGGFSHLYLGSSSPIDVGIGRLSVRVELGRLDQSAYSPVASDSGRREMAGSVITFSPGVLTGLELGGARFFHRRWRGVRLRDLTLPFEGFTSLQINNSAKYDPTDPAYEPANQLASLFGRWVFPASGFEAYGEYFRNDRNYDARDLLLEPDHDAAFTLGFQKTWTAHAGKRLVAFHSEFVNAQISHLANLRPESWPYTHGPIAQGHTQNGQALGSFVIERGGGGQIIGVDWFTERGRSGLELMRLTRANESVTGLLPGRHDVMFVGRGSLVRSRDRWETFARVTAIYELDRNFESDAFNIGLATGVRGFD